MDIDVFTFIEKNSRDYAKLLRATMEHFKSGNHEIHYKAIESVGVKKGMWPAKWEKKGRTRHYNHLSLQHAVGIHNALEEVESEYCVFVDCDVAVLYQDWDEVIIKELDKYDCFGGAMKNKQKYKNFPSSHFFCFKKSLLETVELDFQPFVKKYFVRSTKIRNEIESTIYGIVVGGVLKKDVGYRLPETFYYNNLINKSMPMICMYENSRLLGVTKKEYLKCIESRFQQSEWHYKGKLFATHKQASYTHEFDSKYTKIWVDRINRHTGETFA